jgi:hypothetical protein
MRFLAVFKYHSCDLRGKINLALIRYFADSAIRRIARVKKYPAKRLNSAVFLKFCALSAKKTNIADTAATRLRKF